MGRGRAKAKQTKVARELKYSSPDTDFSALEQELHGSPDAVSASPTTPVGRTSRRATGSGPRVELDADLTEPLATRAGHCRPSRRTRHVVWVADRPRVQSARAYARAMSD